MKNHIFFKHIHDSHTELRKIDFCWLLLFILFLPSHIETDISWVESRCLGYNRNIYFEVTLVKKKVYWGFVYRLCYMQPAQHCIAQMYG